MGIGLAIAAGLAFLLPHVVPLHRVAPLAAAGVWFLALVLRALVAVAGAAVVLAYVPQTETFAAAAGWCGHAVLPFVSAHLGLFGHPPAHAVVVLPALVLACSACWLLARIAGGSHGLRTLPACTRSQLRCARAEPGPRSTGAASV